MCHQPLPRGTKSDRSTRLFKPVNIKVDIFLVLGEVTASLLITIFYEYTFPVIIVGSLSVVFMCLTLYFRLMGGWRGKTDFFSGCDVSGMKSGHRPWAIIFGHQPLAPLVRGESPVIIVIRTCILVGLTLGIPAFGIYVMFLGPMSSQTMTRDIKVSQSWSFDFTTLDIGINELPVDQNITILLSYSGGPGGEGSPGYFNVAAQGCLTTNSSLSWQLTATVTCPFPWSSAPPGGVLLSANFADPWGILYVKAGQGDRSDVDAYTEPIPLVAGARVIAILGLTARKIFSNSAIELLGLATPFRTITTNSVLYLQADPAPPNVTDTVTLRLRLRNDVIWMTRVVEDFADASVLAGFATLGGFWTFANGAFALIFGANILYFLWKTKPLSALGIIHIFQKRTLIQNWHDDFPCSVPKAASRDRSRPGSLRFSANGSWTWTARMPNRKMPRLSPSLPSLLQWSRRKMPEQMGSIAPRLPSREGIYLQLGRCELPSVAVSVSDRVPRIHF
ncbi:hypothetical protein B0H14DRAFT_1402888 [Mycena olivaceomarginata]|nr:hypothetical protein B0H14DRAFT_1402888 [Mycena olivaceomarginata]